MLKIGSIVWGVGDVPRAVEFWCAALDYQPLREPSPDWAILVPRVGEGAQLAISQVSSDEKTISAIIFISTQAIKKRRLIGCCLSVPVKSAGAIPKGADYIVLADPDGKTFCVVQK